MRNTETTQPLSESGKREEDVAKLNKLVLIHKCFHEIADEMLPDPDVYCRILIKLQEMGFSFQDILLWQEYQEALEIYDNLERH